MEADLVHESETTTPSFKGVEGPARIIGVYIYGSY